MSDWSASLRHRLEFAGFLLLRGLARALPERWAIRFGELLGRLAGDVLRIRRRVAEDNVALAFPNRSESWRARVVKASFRHLGREAVSFLRLLQEPAAELRQRTEVSGLDDLEAAVARGRGVVLVTGHYGNWEIGGASLAVRGVPIEVVGFRQSNRLFDAALRQARSTLGMRMLTKGEAPSKVLRALKAGRVVGLPADQDARSSGVFVDFFDVPASTPRGPALFAIRSGAPLFVGVAEALPGLEARYRLRLERVTVPRTGELHEDVRALTQSFTRRLEELVTADPGQYFWQHKRWKTRPPRAGTPGTGS